MTRTLHTTRSQLYGLLEAHEKTKRTSTTVKVDRQALINICMDHPILYSIAKGQVEEPKETSS